MAGPARRPCGNLSNYRMPRFMSGSTFLKPAGTANCESSTAFEEKLESSVVISSSEPEFEFVGRGQIGVECLSQGFASCTAPLGLDTKRGLESWGERKTITPFWNTEDGPPAPSFGFPFWG